MVQVTRKPSYKFFCTQVASCHETIFGETGVFFYCTSRFVYIYVRVQTDVKVIDLPQHTTLPVVGKEAS